MKPEKYLVAGIIVLSCMFSSGLWACSSMGTSTHAGKVMSIDEDANTFTIMDLQTMSPVTFNADKKIMQQIMNAEGTAIVDYTEEGADLTATGVQMQ